MPLPNGDAMPMVQPQPMPTQFTVGQVRSDQGAMLVVLQVFTPGGQAVYFLDADAAIQVGQSLRLSGKAAKSDLILPGNGMGP
jgi:hypothetical protein